MTTTSETRMSDTTTREGQTVLRTVTTRTETEHVAVVTLERKDDTPAGLALTTTAGSANVGVSHGGGAAHLGASTTTVPSLSTMTSGHTTTATGGGGGGHSSTARSRDTSLHRETHHYTGSGGAGGATHLPSIATTGATTSATAVHHATTNTSIGTAGTTVPTATLTTNVSRPQIESQESYTMVKTKTKAPMKSTQSSSTSKFVTSSAGGGGGYATDTEGGGGAEYRTSSHNVVPLVPQIHHEHYQHHVGTTTGGSAGIERKVPMTTLESKHESTYQYSKPHRTKHISGGGVGGGGVGTETDTDTEDEKRRTATSSRTGYHSATEQSYASQKHHHVHKNYDNEYHQRKKRETKILVARSRVRRRAAIRRWCRCDSVCFLLILSVLHILVASTITGLNIAAWIISGMWLIKVIDFLFWVFALGFLAFLTGIAGLVIVYKLRSPYGYGNSGVGRSRTINTLRGSHLHGGTEFSKEEERLVGLSSHGMGGGSTTGAIPNDHTADLGGGGVNDLEETETSYGDVQAQRRKHRIHYALLFMLCIIVIVLAIVAYLLITYDYHEPMAQRRDNGRDYSVFDESRRPQEATFSKYFTYLFNRVNNMSDEEQIDSAQRLNTLRSLLITFVALEMGLATITLGLAFVYLFRGYRLRCPCLEPDSQSNEMNLANGTQPVIVSPSQMTLGSRAGAGGTLSGYGVGMGGGGHVVREFDREERETVRLVA